MRGLVLIAAAASLAGCVYDSPMDETPARPDLPPLASNQDEPRLALVEHVLNRYFSSDIVAPPTICASVTDGRSEIALPPEQETALIERFPRLAPFSRCSWNGSAWQDAETEEPALVFTVYNFSCASETSCAGWASYTAGNTGSPANLYRMDYAGGRWTFERDRRLIAE